MWPAVLVHFGITYWDAAGIGFACFEGELNENHIFTVSPLHPYEPSVPFQPISNALCTLSAALWTFHPKGTDSALLAFLSGCAERKEASNKKVLSVHVLFEIDGR